MVNRYGNGPEPLTVSANGVPYNKAHLDAKDAEIADLKRDRDSWRRTAEKLEGEKQSLLLKLSACNENLDSEREENERLRALLAQRDLDLDSHSSRLETSENRLKLAMHMLTELGVDNQYFADKAKAILGEPVVERQEPVGCTNPTVYPEQCAHEISGATPCENCPGSE